MDEVRLYEMYLNEAIEERKTDLINRNEEYKELRENFNDIMNKYPNLQFILEDREMILNETECKMLQELAPVANLKKKYYKKLYTGPKINRFLLQTSSLYRLYVHYLYAFKILPAKNEYREMTPEYYKQKRKNNMIFEEINFLARYKFVSIKEVEEYKTDLEK